MDNEVSPLTHDRQESATGDREGGERVDQNPKYEIVGGIILSNPIVFGVPDRSEIFRLAVLTDQTIDPLRGNEQWLRVLNPVHLQLQESVATPRAGQRAGCADETEVGVLMQVVSCDIALCRIRVIESKITDEGREVVIEGTEVRRPSIDGTRRVFRVRVDANGLAAHEVISQTHYPG